MTEQELHDWEGQYPVPDMLAQLAREGFSGTLSALSGEAVREILFTDGEIRAARSNLEQEKLGLWLVTQGLISDGDRALSLLAQGGTDAPPLGHLLVIRGHIDLIDLEAELQSLAMTIVRRAAADPESTCAIRSRGEGPAQPDTLPNTTTPQVILCAARELDSFERQLASLGPLDQLVQPAAGLSDLLQGLSLTPTEAFLLSRIEGARSISALLSVSALPREEAIKTLYGLHLAGVVTVGEVSAAPAAARPEGRGAALVDEETLGDAQREERARIGQLASEVRRIDHYQALCIGSQATPREIDEAWRSISNRFHPDRAVTPHLRDLRQELTAVYERAGEAYEVLSDRNRRNRYNKILGSIQTGERPGERVERQEASQGARQELVEANFKRAEEFIRDGELYLAIQLLEQACAIDPRPAELVKLARLLVRNPLWANRAIDNLRKATEIDPSFADAWVELAVFWRGRKHPERQRKALERAIAADPDHERACQLYASLVNQHELQRLRKRALQRLGRPGNTVSQRRHG